MRIGELAKQTGCDVETVRYYERAGLLPEPLRSDAGYRLYQPEHLERLQFIRHCRSLHMGIPDIRVLLNFKAQPTIECQGVNDLLDHHIELIRVQMKKLQSLEQQLMTLRRQCEEPHLVKECGILQNLNDAASSIDCACHGGQQQSV
jgi:Cd(II)/Pb(II)-responsive transcriptional regulator